MVWLQAQTPLEIIVRCLDSGKEMPFKVLPETRLQRIFTAFAERLSLDVAKLRFVNDGRLHWHKSVQEAEIEGGDVILCMSEQVGD